MKKQIQTTLMALFCTLITTTAFAADTAWRDPSVIMKDWKTVSVLDVALDESNEGDEFLREALTYELMRIGEDKLDKLTYQQGENETIQPDAYLSVELNRYEKEGRWINASSDIIENRHTRTEEYRDRKGNERTRYITHIATEIRDYPAGYAYHSYVQAKISVLDPNSMQAVYTYIAADDSGGSTIDVYRDIVEDFYKKWKKEMKK